MFYSCKENANAKRIENRVCISLVIYIANEIDWIVIINYARLIDRLAYSKKGHSDVG